MYGKRTATLKCHYFPFREQYFYFCLQAHGSSLARSVHYFCVGPADSDMCANSDTSVFSTFRILQFIDIDYMSKTIPLKSHRLSGIES